LATVVPIDGYLATPYFLILRRNVRKLISRISDVRSCYLPIELPCRSSGRLKVPGWQESYRACQSEPDTSVVSPREGKPSWAKRKTGNHNALIVLLITGNGTQSDLLNQWSTCFANVLSGRHFNSSQATTTSQGRVWAACLGFSDC